MARRKPIDYAGASASTRISTITDVTALGSKWVVQVKADGWHCILHTDRQGRIRHVRTRNDANVPQALSGHLFGALVAWPNSVLHGELVGELVHLYDCSYADGRYIAHESYSARRDVLHRMQSEIVNINPERSWEPVQGLRARDKLTGEYVRAVPEDWRLTPIVDQFPVSKAPELWERALEGEIEGLVAVNTEAKLGARASKIKLKGTSSIDCTVLRVDKGGCLVYWAPGDKLIALGNRKGVEVKPGDVVEVIHEREMKFCRLSRTRPDLTPVIPLRLAV